MKLVPIGIENFKEMIDKNAYYVNKTNLIENVLNEQSVFFTRPRRFGKTLNMSMLYYFFSIKEKENAYLFNGLNISKNKEAIKHQNKYPVIFIFLKDMKNSSYEKQMNRFKEVICLCAKSHLESLNSERLLASEKKLFQKYVNNELEREIFNISYFPYKHYHQKVIILIDEYDVPLQSAYQYNYYDEMVEFNGIVTDFDTLVFRNQEVEVDWDGSFNIQASLKDGPNELELIATDLAGNQTTYTAVVTKLVVEKKEVPWKTIIFTGIAVLILIILFIIKKRGFHLSNVIPDSGENPARKYHRPTSFTDYFCFFICLIVVIIFVYVIFNISFVTSGSMEPTIKERELTITNRLAYTVKDPGRGDIVICRAGDQNELMLKRIIGLPNDEISFVDGYVFINGVICDESAYLKSDVETNCTESFTVPEGCYFLLGDNRENSIDSRHWNNTFVKRENLIGKIIFHINFNS